MTGQSWYLPVLIAVPLVGAILVAMIRDQRTAKLSALVISLIPVVLAVLIWIDHRNWQTNGGGVPQTADYVPSLLEVQRAFYSAAFSVDWIPTFGVHFSLGVDGISLTMIALIVLLVPIVFGASWEEKLPEGRSQSGYFALILVLEAAMIGVFAATDVFLFYVLFEVMLIPMYFLIGAFGGLRGSYAAMKFFLYSLLGGLLMLASLIGLYVASGHVLGSGSLDWVTLRSIASQIPESTQLWIFAGFAIAFAIKAPLVPLHTWLPDAGAEAPVGAGTLLVGVLDKVGTFGFLRICLPLLPAASSKLAWLILLLGAIGVIYGAIVAAGQTDMKRFVTFTSIAHFGFICMGIFAFTTEAISGAALYMVNHGIATALIFLIVGMLASRGGSRLIGDYGGVWKVAPILGGLFLVGSFATIAVPGTNSFVSEFLVLIGLFHRYPAWSIVATVGIVFAALYMLWVFQRVMTGPVRGSAVLEGGGPEGVELQPTDDTSGAAAPLVHGGHDPADPEQRGSVLTAPAPTRARVRFGDLKAREIGVLTPLVVLVILLGVYPQPVLDVLNPTAQQTVSSSGHDPNDPTGPYSQQYLQQVEGAK
jgi:NADH-quinone oxidoreductase subunit M